MEELFKGLAVVLLVAIARTELDDVLDGFVWGAMVGIGFLLVEDVFYFVRAASDTGSIVAVFQMFLIRIIGAGPYSHFLYTGLVGMGIAYAVVRGDKPVGARRLGATALIAAGVGAHFLWNSPILSGLLGDGDSLVGWVAYVTAKGLPMLIGLVLVVQLARRRERRWFAAFAAGFADDGSITPAEVTELAGLRSRRRARNAAGRERGPRGKQLKGRLQHQQLGLAMAFSKHRSEGHPDVAHRMAEIAATRAEYAALGSTAAAGASGWATATRDPVPGVGHGHDHAAAGCSAGRFRRTRLAPHARRAGWRPARLGHPGSGARTGRDAGCAAGSRGRGAGRGLGEGGRRQWLGRLGGRPEARPPGLNPRNRSATEPGAATTGARSGPRGAAPTARRRNPALSVIEC